MVHSRCIEVPFEALKGSYLVIAGGAWETPSIVHQRRVYAILVILSAPGVHYGHEKATPESGDFELSCWCERGDSNPHRPKSTRS